MNLEFSVNGDANEPVSRGEFAEAMQLIGRAFDSVATKDDLKGLATKEDLKDFATKDDLKQLARDFELRFATKDDLKQMVSNFEQRFATKDDLHQLEERLSAQIDQKLDKWGRLIFNKIDAAIEDRQIDLGAATREHAEAMQERQDRLDSRVTAIEHHVGLPPAA